jgi:hypothetical protein
MLTRVATAAASSVKAAARFLRQLESKTHAGKAGDEFLRQLVGSTHGTAE